MARKSSIMQELSLSKLTNSPIINNRALEITKSLEKEAYDIQKELERFSNGLSSLVSLRGTDETFFKMGALPKRILEVKKRIDRMQKEFQWVRSELG